MYVLPEDFLWLEEKCNPLLQYNWILLSETGIFCIEHDKGEHYSQTVTDISLVQNVTLQLKFKVWKFK